jgi:APA family basic amino acid/polyamine antiporter
MYAISFAQYLQGIFPGAPITPVAMIVMTVFFVANLLGIEGAAKLEIVMDIVLALAMALFIVYGIPRVDFESFLTVDFAPAGPMGILTCGMLLTWATAGGIDMVNLSAEAKNPTKDLPQVMMVSTAAIAVFYALIAVVAAGVLPVSETADMPLDLVAKQIFPYPLFLFFIIGGALLALSTTLNATFAWVTKPILQACNDGWLPKKMGYVHPRFKTPVIILIFFYAIGAAPILFGIEIGRIADTAVILSNILFVLICFGAVFIPKRMPELWEKSAFHFSKRKLYLWSILGGVSSTIMAVVLLLQTTRFQFIGMLVIAILGVLFAHFRYRSGAVKVQESIEEL